MDTPEQIERLALRIRRLYPGEQVEVRRLGGRLRYFDTPLEDDDAPWSEFPDLVEQLTACAAELDEGEILLVQLRGGELEFRTPSGWLGQEHSGCYYDA